LFVLQIYVDEDQPIKTIVKSLERWWLMSLRCPWLES
jgi:hypothetical protein